jgi:hypothetical protein
MTLGFGLKKRRQHYVLEKTVVNPLFFAMSDDQIDFNFADLPRSPVL